MNWTGGQLRRHSARQSILSKTQKQNFARSRQQASNRVPGQPSTFRGVPGPNIGDNDRLDDKTACRDRQMMEEDAQNHTTLPSLRPLAGSVSAGSTLHLNTLKRRLLQDPDWAAVSAARPLEVTFASAQDAERFGKRRRLTETDRERLSATHGNQRTLAFPKSDDWRENENALDRIQIRITGQPSSQHLQNGQGLQTPPNRHASHDLSQSPGLYRPRLSANVRYSAHLRSDPSSTVAPPSTESLIPHRRHVVVENQVLQEQMGCGPHLLPSQPRQREASCSPTETLQYVPDWHNHLRANPFLPVTK
ncbi:hypothetical protein PEBR_21208 [Penicillium brasilianum]|uniref:Uncharacterized protein n=1 Tax=Penicillium brasilianum TaxID=104259 RepID=A0A1S9RN70_PENBI|nr:hypothetical protein PEBR_21208 [Penicillium brasilianum]